MNAWAAPGGVNVSLLRPAMELDPWPTIRVGQIANTIAVHGLEGAERGKTYARKSGKPLAACARGGGNGLRGPGVRDERAAALYGAT